MNKKQADQITKIISRAAHEIDLALNPPGKPPKKSTGEAAQEAHEAALASFNTKCKNGMILSLNAAPDNKKQG